MFSRYVFGIPIPPKQVVADFLLDFVLSILFHMFFFPASKHMVIYIYMYYVDLLGNWQWVDFLLPFPRFLLFSNLRMDTFNIYFT